jgi:hypothetical protein
LLLESKVPFTQNRAIELEQAIMTKRGVYALPLLFSPMRNARLPTGSQRLDRQAVRLFEMKRAIPIGRVRNRFSFRRRSPCLRLPTPCVPLHPPARHAIHYFLRCDRLSESAYRWLAPSILNALEITIRLICQSSVSAG